MKSHFSHTTVRIASAILALGALAPLTGAHRRKFGTSALALLLAAVLWPAATAQAAVYGFNMLGPMISTNQDGDTIRVTGSGTFDDETELIHAKGAYTITDSAGKVKQRGTWFATDFGSFESDGGPNKGLQGGDLDLTITLLPDGGTAEEGVSMTLRCPFDDGAFDNPNCFLIVGDFVNPAGGVMVFHLVRS
jgi:hypothetical protein